MLARRVSLPIAANGIVSRDRAAMQWRSCGDEAAQEQKLAGGDSRGLTAPAQATVCLLISRSLTYLLPIGRVKDGMGRLRREQSIRVASRFRRVSSFLALITQ